MGLAQVPLLVNTLGPWIQQMDPWGLFISLHAF